jgi:hypothetical protein
MKNDEAVVGSFLDVALNPVRAQFDSSIKRFQRVIRRIFSEATVSDI